MKVNALKADFKVPIRVVQKFINRNEVKPISSQPKNIIIVFPEETKNNILTTKDAKNKIKRSTKGS